MFERWLTLYKIRIVIGVIVLFFVSMFESCQELRYMMFSKTTDATLNDNHVEKSEQDGETVLKRVISYSYKDGDTYRQRYVDVPMDWDGANAGGLKVQYLPGKQEMYSRLVGQNNMTWVVIFFVSLVAGAAGLFWLSREE
jgi:hypothetical protein